MKKWIALLLAMALLALSPVSLAGAAERGAFRLDRFSGGAMGMEFIPVVVDADADILSVWPNQQIKNVVLEELTLDENGRVLSAEPLYIADVLESNQVLNIQAFEPEILPTLRVRGINEAGENECWYIGVSGENGDPLLLTADEAGVTERKEFAFSDLSGLVFTFCSGVGAWATEMVIDEDGSFSGRFHDSDMGDTGETHPNGTVYGCLFEGQLEIGEWLNDTTLRLKMTALTQPEGSVPQAIEDGILYVTSDPYGLTGTDELILYLPGTPVSELPDGYLMWAHFYDGVPEKLPFYGLYNEKEACGFVGETPIMTEGTVPAQGD